MDTFHYLFAASDATCQPDDDAALDIDPNNYDWDPGGPYQELSELFNVPGEDDEFWFGGFGGTLGHTIEFIEARWDGILHQRPAGA